MVNACPIPPMHFIVLLLPGHHSSILSSNASTSKCRSISPIAKGPVHITNWKGAVHIPNQKGAMQKVWIRAPHQHFPKKMPSACTVR